MTPADLAEEVRAAIGAAVAAHDLDVPVPPTVTIERPKNRQHGDYSTNAAMQLAKPAGRPPREVADIILRHLLGRAGIAGASVAGPGFLNITVAQDAFGDLARSIVVAGAEYGRGHAMRGQDVNLEFVSANPTGPMHLGGGRWAAVGDSLARLMEASGATVTREYYFNDHGTQIDRFASSLLASARGREVPEDGYAGSYIDDIAGRVVADHPEIADLDDAAAQEVFRAEGVALMFPEVKQTLHDFGVDFDVYFHEASLHTSGAVERAVERLRQLGTMYEADGATWLRTTDFGDDKDRPVIKSDGNPAYIAGDIAYYLDKRQRGADRVVILLGADHHGYIGRMMAVCAAFGDTPGENLEILIGQMVNLVKDGAPMRMSKRAGTVLTLEDLTDAIGVDAARYALERYSLDSTIDIDLELWSRKTSDNPVFYVQYAHARIASLLRNAAELGISRGDDLDPSLLTAPQEGELLGELGEFPRVVASAAELREPHRVARYLEALAGTYHRFYDACRVLPMGDEPATDLTVARLWLVEATRIVLANGLGLLGVSAPERM